MLILVGLLGWYGAPQTLKFEENIFQDIPTMLGSLLLVSLFVERAIRIFLLAWHSGGADELGADIANLKKRISKSIGEPDPEGKPKPAKAETKKLNKELEAVEKERTIYRAKSRFIAKWLGLRVHAKTN